MADADDLVQALDDMARLQDRVLKAHHFFTTVWQERADLYATIIVGMKLGKRHWFSSATPATMADFEAEIRRIEVLNVRERRIWNAIKANQQLTEMLRDRIINTLSRIDAGSTSAYALLDSRALTMLSKLTQEYFRTVAARQGEFLALERTFIARKDVASLRAAFCSMKKLQQQLTALQAEYDHASAAYPQLLNTQRALNQLYESLETGRRESKTTDATTPLERALAALRPYVDRRNVNMFGNTQQRIAWLLTQQPKIITSTIIRMAIFVPFLKYYMGGYEKLGTLTLPNSPSISLNLFLFIVSMIALFMEVGPGFSKYVIEGPAKLTKLIRERTRSDDPLGFACPA
jgi:hypothetical protein